MESIVARLSDAVIAAEPNGRVLFANPAALDLFPFDAADVPIFEWPKRCSLFLPDRITPVPLDHFPLARALQGDAVESMEMYMAEAGAADGVWIACSAAPLRDEGGQVSAVVLTCRDITAARRPKPEDWAAKIVETVGTLVVVVDCRGEIVSFNRTCEQTTGYTFEEVRGLHVWDRFLLAEETEEIEPAKRVFEDLRAGEFPSQHENYWVAKDGRRHLIAWSNTAMTGPDGAVEFIIGTGMDITDRKRTEDQLRQANETLRAVIETSPLAIVTMDLAGGVTGWNRTAEEMFGWRASEVLGKPFPSSRRTRTEPPGNLLTRRCLLLLTIAVTAPAQVTVPSGVPLLVAIEHPVAVKRVGEPVRGGRVESIYVFNRVALPAGSAFEGHIAEIGGVPARRCLAATLSGAQSPKERSLS